MPKYICMKDDLLKLIEAGPIDLEKLEMLLESAKSELKEFDAATGELKLENNDTNRPDLWSAEGTARQIRSCFYGKVPEYGFFRKSPAPDDRIIVSPEMKEIRPFIGGFRVTGIAVDEMLLLQLIQTQEKLSENFGRARDLISIGIYDASQIHFPVFYKAVAPGQIRFVPLDFAEEMDLGEILEKHPKGIQYAPILKAHPLYPIFLDSRNAVLSFPPIINSNDLGRIVPGNSHLFVESTGKERDAVTLALNILACNLADRGAEIHPFAVEYPDGAALTTPWKFERSLSLDLDYVEKYVGCSIGMDRLVEKLKHMGIACLGVNEKTEQSRWSLPPYRLDGLHPVDLVEDYCIGSGYNSFTPTMPEKFTVGMSAPLMEFSAAVRDLLTGMSFQEVMTYILTSRDTLCTRMECDDSPLEIENIMSDSYSVVRSRLHPILLEIESKNPKSEYPHRIFELGEVAFRDENSAERTRTVNNVAALVAHNTANFSEINSYLQSLLYHIGMEYGLEKAEHPSFIAGRVGRILVRGKECGVIGEVHPRVLENWGISYPCALFEMTLDGLA